MGGLPGLSTRGLTGDKGATGVPGPEGEKGQSGIPGRPGLTGVTGMKGGQVCSISPHASYNLLYYWYGTMATWPGILDNRDILLQRPIIVTIGIGRLYSCPCCICGGNTDSYGQQTS